MVAEEVNIMNLLIDEAKNLLIRARRVVEREMAACGGIERDMLADVADGIDQLIDILDELI